MRTDRWINAVGVLKTPTLNLLAAQVGGQGCLVMDGWCATDPKQVKAWEKDGTLLQRAKEANDQAAEASRKYEADKAANSGMPALASFEINEIYGGPSSRL